MYWNVVGKFGLPFGQTGRYDWPSKSRSPFWNLSWRHWLAADVSLTGDPLMNAVRVPCLKQGPSENSHSAPLAALLVGQATGPLGLCVVAFRQRPVVRLHGPSPLAFLPSAPPLQVSKTCGSV